MRNGHLRVKLDKLKKSLIRTEGNLFSCLGALFGVEESQIYEDFIQLTELVHHEIDYFNRSEISNGKGMKCKNLVLRALILFLPLRSKKAGRFEKLLGFTRSHCIVTPVSVSL